ncbi:nucleotidyltransferase [Shewanella sp. 10N.286.52.A9]|uniref:nucleotidyltransferase n=1 Tax=Shewanella sp. 10N.286.52.A9 TaxID=3229711 RepID=UPI00354ADAF5
MVNIVSREDALQEAASKLDISPSKYKQAIERFNSMKSFLLEGEYDGAMSPPDVYLQGSFKLGTEIRPFKDSKDSDYDIDLVCCLGHMKQFSQASTIKNQVGDRIKSNGTYSRMLDDEGKRCWTLNYAEEDNIGFHMDVLPAVNEQSGVGQIHSIAATNKNQDESYTWTTSNPKGFAEWFYQRNGEAFQLAKLSQKQQIFNNQRQLFNSIDEVPNIHVKTPLQRAIQILKRHRDIRFSQSDIELCKPISMVITVLAASCYRNENTIYSTLSNLISLLEQQAAQLNNDFVFNDYFSRSTYNLITRKSNGTWLIQNPANPGENFADRWHEDDHARAKAFFQWVSWLKEDFINIDTFVENDRFTKSLVDVYRPSNLPALHFNVQHKEHGGWPVSLNQDYNVEIKASYKTNVFWKKFESGQPLLKGKDLKFKVNTNIPKPFDIYWQVVNTGQEAANAGQLRGEISEHTNRNSSDIYRTESTSYTGDHWVECYVIKNGNCVARSGEFIVSIRDRF